MTKNEAYSLAREIDSSLEKIIVKHPIASDNVKAWAIFLRTVRSTLDMLEHQLCLVNAASAKRDELI